MAYKMNKFFALLFAMLSFTYALDEWKAISPPTRNAARIVVDNLNQRAILFGWTQLFPSGEAPFVRRNSAGVYDFFNDNFIVFGGDYRESYITYYWGETYILDIYATTISEWKKPTLNIEPTIFINSPSSGTTRIRYLLPKIDNIKVDIVDVSGRIIKTLFSRKPSATTGWLLWDRKDEYGREMSSGVFYCRLETEGLSISKKFVALKY